MSVNLNTRVIDSSVPGAGAPLWYRLHSEREGICEALLNDAEPKTSLLHGVAHDQSSSSAGWHRELLQARLRKIDDALDRLMSGSYGNCCKCGRWIEDTKLAFDPAVAFCVECWQREQAQAASSRSIGRNGQTQSGDALKHDALDESGTTDVSANSITLVTLSAFDTVWVQTLNSEYRLFLLDPMTGRALVEGGPHFVEPEEAVVSGSTSGGSSFRSGRIVIGFRMEIWINGRLVITSPVKSVTVERFESEVESTLCQ